VKQKKRKSALSKPSSSLVNTKPIGISNELKRTLSKPFVVPHKVEGTVSSPLISSFNVKDVFPHYNEILAYDSDPIPKETRFVYPSRGYLQDVECPGCNIYISRKTLQQNGCCASCFIKGCPERIIRCISCFKNEASIGILCQQCVDRQNPNVEEDEVICTDSD